MSTYYSPTSKAALSLPETLPAALLQALIPCPRFNGHKPSLFFEGEGQLDKLVVNKINTTSEAHSLIVGTMLKPFNPLFDLNPPLSGLKPNRKLHWKLFKRKESSIACLTPLLLRHSTDLREHESHYMDQEKLLEGLKMGVV
jgi:hypothetical protein